MPGQDFIEVPDVPPIRVLVAPAHHAVHSLSLVSGIHDLSGFNEWVIRTRDAMTPAELAQHKLVVLGFFHAIVPERNWSSFPAYIDHLAALDPVALRDKMLNFYLHMIPCPECPQEKEPLGLDVALQDADGYVRFLLSRFPADNVDEEMERKAFSYVADPSAMQELIVSYLREFWDLELRAEWDRVEPMLRDSEKAFGQVDFSGMSSLESWKLITGHEMSEEKWQEAHQKVKRITYVPSAHVGPYLGKLWDSEHKFWVLFGARIPEGVQIDAPDLSRAEIVVRLNALADDTRLRLLKLVAEEGELRSQDIMDRLGLSQSAASRQLKQLSATGYLNERRCEGAKCYAFNPERLDGTCSARSKHFSNRRTQWLTESKSGP